MDTAITIDEVVAYLEQMAPPSYQESYDNAGLITGSREWTCSGILATLDATEAVVEEAARRGCNLIVAHHPIVFSGLKKINGRNYVEKAVITSIKKDIAIYAIHTNLDNVVARGVNGKIAAKLGLSKARPLLPKEGVLRKLFCFVPVGHLEPVRNALFAAGAGHIGQYSECSWSTEGSGTFKGGEGTNPFVGQPGLRHSEREARVEMVFPAHLSGAVVRAMVAAHPYEEPAYDLVDLANSHPGVGSGLVGDLPAPVDEKAFLEILRTVFRVPVVRHTSLTGRPVQRVALCGGAGSSLISRALAEGAAFYITADVKYHEFFDANDRMVVADVGHFESEQYTVDLLFEVLQEKFCNFAVLKSETTTNPIHYYGAGSM